MFELKPLDPEAVPRAMTKAERYRLLGEPEEAESICLDILAIEPDNQQALVALLLSLTDQFHNDCADCYNRAQAILPRLESEYHRCYYAGIICERRGSAMLEQGSPGSGSMAYIWLQQAMEQYERAEAIRPAQNDDAVLRWNSCARIIMKHDLKPLMEIYEPLLQE